MGLCAFGLWVVVVWGVVWGELEFASVEDV